MAGTVVVFDFDKTIIDCDSDNWVVDSLGATELFNRLLPTMPWNTLMDKMMTEIHKQGKSIDDVVETLERTPIHPRIIQAIKSAHALGCDLKIVSDANMFFIETILKHHEISGCFSEINTNPSFVDGEGKLRISPFHDFASSPHGCSLCPPNMCKGMVIKRIQEAALTVEGKKKKKKMVYLGDGSGDYCPTLKLTDGDSVMPRKSYPLWDLIRQNPNSVKAAIHEWSDGEDLGRVLLRVIDGAVVASSSPSSSSLVACNFPAPPHEVHPLPQGMPVRVLL